MRAHVMTLVAAAAGAALWLGGSGHVRAAGAPTITATTTRGLQADGRYHIQVQGVFDNPEDTRAIVICDGSITPSSVHRATQSSLDISISPPRASTRCSVIAHRSTDGAESGPGVLVDTAGLDVIGGVLDRGSTGTAMPTWHGVELYGTFPNFSNLRISVACMQGGDVNARQGPNTGYNPHTTILSRSLSQLNVQFDDPGPSSSYVNTCTFTPVSANTGCATGPTFGPWAPRAYDAYAGTANFGVYYWGVGASVEPTAEDALASGQRWMSRSGFHTARVLMSPKMRHANDNGDNLYHINLDLFAKECPVVCPQGAACTSSPPFLPCAARSSSYQRLFSSPETQFIILTAVDSSSTDDYGGKFQWLSTWTAGQGMTSKLAWFDADGNSEKVRAEYRNLALAIYETQHDSGKAFVIANWETDSQIFPCRDDAPPDPCPQYPLPVLRDWVAGFTRWFMLRKQGIADARAVAQARGLGGVTVSDGIEFNVFRSNPNYPEQTHGALYTINSIIPSVMPSYMLYSAWGSTGAGALDQDLQTLKTRFPSGGPQLLVGELAANGGMSGSTAFLSGLSDAWITAQSARAAQRAHLPATILWIGYDGSPATDANYAPAFYASNGAERPVVQKVRSALNAGAAELASNPPARIGGIVVTRAGQWDLFEMYIDQSYGNGSFPASLSEMEVRCNYDCGSAQCTTSDMTIDTLVFPDSAARGPSQSNVRILHRNRPWEDVVPGQPRDIPRFCTVKIRGVLMHGPILLPP
jgi:hypothetical protein